MREPRALPTRAKAVRVSPARFELRDEIQQEQTEGTEESRRDHPRLCSLLFLPTPVPGHGESRPDGAVGATAAFLCLLSLFVAIVVMSPLRGLCCFSPIPGAGALVVLQIFDSGVAVWGDRMQTEAAGGLHKEAKRAKGVMACLPYGYWMN